MSSPTVVRRSTCPGRRRAIRGTASISLVGRPTARVPASQRGLMMAAPGSDTGGSICNPAALCGVAGLKPTYGLVSRFGVYTNSFSYDHAGPMTWSVEDCAIMLQAIAGHDPKDPASADGPVPDYRAALTGGIQGLLISVLRHLFEQDAPIPLVAKAALEAGIRSTARVRRRAGGRPHPTCAGLPRRQDHRRGKRAVCGARTGAAQAARRFREDCLGRTLAALLISGADYVQASRWRRVLIAEMVPLYGKYDILLTAAPEPAPCLDSWRTINFGQNHR